MYQKNITKILEKVFAIAIEVALVFWNQILAWTHSNFLLWIQKYMIPMLPESVKLAFTAVAKITPGLPDSIKAAWQEVKKILLGMNVQFKNVDSSTAWKKRETSIMIKKNEANQSVVVKREIEEDLDWDNLPPEVRESWLKGSQQNYKIDVMETREKELEAMTMEQ